MDSLNRGALARAHEAARAPQMQMRTSKPWVARNSDLVRECHPKKNGDVFRDPRHEVMVAAFPVVRPRLRSCNGAFARRAIRGGEPKTSRRAVALARGGGAWQTSAMPVTDLFAALVAPNKRHAAFEALRTSPWYAPARRLMNELYGLMGDPEGGFVKDFQTDGFHSRLFELACYAYLTEQEVGIDRSHEAPDYVISKDGKRVAVEAVTSNPPAGRLTDISLRQLTPLTDDEVADKCNNEFPIRIGGALRTKVKKRYWDLPHCAELPFVLIVGPFHEPGSVTYTDESLARYLYGIERYSDWREFRGVLVREAPVTNHSFGSKTIPSNFFAIEQGAENVSAVVWSNQFTVPRFVRLVAQAVGWPEGVIDVVRRGAHALPDGISYEPYEYRPMVDQRRESWSSGVTILHNPRARRPLPDGLLRGTSSYRLRDGRLVREIHGFHPVTSAMQVQVQQIEEGLEAELS